MSEDNLKRFPRPDGSVKVVNMETGEDWIEGAADDTAKAAPRATPFATPTQERSAEVVPIEKPKLVTNEDVQKAAPEPDLTEQLANEASRVEPIAYPVGSPELRSLLRLQFKRRANAMRLYQLAIDAWNRMPSNGTNLDTPDKLERYFGALQAFDEFLESVAVNPVAYRSWVDNTDDGTFGELFFAYISRFGLGESSSSSS